MKIPIKANSNICIIKNYYMVSLFVLVFLSELSGNAFFSRIGYFSKVVNIIEVIIYAVLVFVIIKKKYLPRELVLIAILGVILLYGYIESGMAAYFRGLLLIVAAKDEDFKEILFTCFYAMIISFGVTFILYIIGLAPDLNGEYIKQGMALGYGHPNHGGQVLSTIYILWYTIVYLEKKKRNILLSLLAGIFVYIITNSKTALAIIVVMPIVVIVAEYIINNHNKNIILKGICCSFQAILFAFTYITAHLYLTNKIVQDIDLFLTNRIFLNWYAFTNNEFSLFGQKMNLYATGVYNPVRDLGNITTTVDNAYAYSLLIMGLIPSLIVSIVYIYVVKKCWENKEAVLIAVAIIIGLYGLTETVILNIYINFIYLYILSRPITDKENLIYDT